MMRSGPGLEPADPGDARAPSNHQVRWQARYIPIMIPHLPRRVSVTCVTARGIRTHEDHAPHRRR